MLDNLRPQSPNECPGVPQVDVMGDDYQGQLPTAETYMAQLAGIPQEAVHMEQLVPQVMPSPPSFPALAQALILGQVSCARHAAYCLHIIAHNAAQKSSFTPIPWLRNCKEDF